MFDPYHPKAVWHKAVKISSDGKHASALCFEPNPRRIRLPNKWTMYNDSAVTCPKCLKIIKSNQSPAAPVEGVGK